MANEEWDDIRTPEENGEEEEQKEVMDAVPTGKYERLLKSDSRKFKLSGMFKDWFLG